MVFFLNIFQENLGLDKEPLLKTCLIESQKVSTESSLHLSSHNSFPWAQRSKWNNLFAWRVWRSLILNFCTFLHELVLERMKLIFFIGCCKIYVRPKQCWNHRDVLVIAEQCLHSAKAFSHCPATEQAGGAQEDGRYTGWTTDPGWPHWYPTSYNVMLSNKSWEKEE